MAAALIVNIGVAAFIQMLVSKQNHMANSTKSLEIVRERLVKNDEDIADLKNTLGENNLAKSRAFAEMLALDPRILEDADRLEEVKERLMVYELNIINEEGIIIQSTVDEYLGFYMGSGDQSAVFMPIIEDPSLEIVQEPTVNVALGIVVQYIGVARKDAPGFVQVGIRPEVLENMLAGTKIDVVLNDIGFGDSGCIYAADAAEGTVLACPDAEWIGKPAQEAGIPLEEGKGSATICGVSGKYVSQEYNGMYIGTFLPLAEYYRNQFIQTIVMSFSIFIIFSVLLYFINALLLQ